MQFLLLFSKALGRSPSLRFLKFLSEPFSLLASQLLSSFIDRGTNFNEAVRRMPSIDSVNEMASVEEAQYLDIRAACYNKSRSLLQDLLHLFSAH